MIKRTFSPKEVAQAVGVSESSLKRWADDGRLVVNRTLGGHRRIAMQEVIRFARDVNLPIRRPEILGLGDAATAQTRGRSDTEIRQNLMACLEEGRSHQTRSMILDLFLNGRPLAWIFDELISPAMHRIGETWQHDRTGIFTEHRATDICVQSINLLRSLMVDGTQAPDAETVDATAEINPGERDPASDPLAIGGAPPGDPYLLPSLMVTTILLELGFRAINLGGDTPLPILEEATTAHRPALIWLSFSSHQHHVSGKEIIDMADRLAAHGSAMVVGGQAMPALPTQRSRNLHVSQNMADLCSFARGVMTRL